MKTKVKALQKFYHGNKMIEPGKSASFTKGEAEEMSKAGLVEIVEDASPESETKIDAAPENKMADAPRNKSTTKK